MYNDSALFNLKASTKLEPLNWNWYAWPQLIAPSTAALNINNRLFKLAESFVLAPHIHKMASDNPSLMGGFFINLEEEFVPRIKELCNYMKNECRDLILLGEKLQSFNNHLIDKSNGHSLESFYAELPEELRGIVELVYDLNDSPMIRLIEPLIYQRYYTNKYQSIILSETIEDFRPFSLTTPKFASEEELEIKIPFNDERIDFIAELRRKPVTLKEIYDTLNLNSEQQKTILRFLSPISNRFEEKTNYGGEGVRIRYYGHACVLLETNNTSILIDPAISYQFDTSLKRYTFNDLPDKIDYILFTHAHDDHVLIETLLQIRHKVNTVIVPNNTKGSIIDPSLKLILKHLGFKNVYTLEEFDELNLSDGCIIGIPFLGEHCDLNIQSKLGYFIKLKNKSFAFVADSNNLDQKIYEQVFDIYGSVDVLFIGMECEGAPLSWLYGPLLPKKINNSIDQSRRLSGSNFEKAWQLATAAKCKHAYVYAMGQEPWLGYIMALNYSENSIQIQQSNLFVKTCQENSIISERLYLQKEWVFN